MVTRKRAKPIQTCALQALGDVVRHARWRQGLTVSELARRSGIHRNTIMELERTSTGTWKTILDLQEVLRFRFAELDGEWGRPEPPR